jgi:hypothetical protein
VLDIDRLGLVNRASGESPQFRGGVDPLRDVSEQRRELLPFCCPSKTTGKPVYLTKFPRVAAG